MSKYQTPKHLMFHRKVDFTHLCPVQRKGDNRQLRLCLLIFAFTLKWNWDVYLNFFSFLAKRQTNKQTGYHITSLSGGNERSDN